MPTRPSQHRAIAARPAVVHSQFDRDRGSASARGYDRAWRRLREQVLTEEPLCRFCLAKGQVTAAREVDHIRTVRDAPELRLVRANLRPLCTPCHSSRTGRDRAAGGAPPLPRGRPHPQGGL
ncbi:HNH endonuclease signature motif containing protein [Roseomonas elaeocarpi]|uniref:Putative HNH nuclease YajD n=1 Tax=Roseomonas elaeocarpi TaxID=907779 RepID=A0ABV6JQD1_9PROT